MGFASTTLQHRAPTPFGEFSFVLIGCSQFGPNVRLYSSFKLFFFLFFFFCGCWLSVASSAVYLLVLLLHVNVYYFSIIYFAISYHHLLSPPYIVIR